MIVKRKRVSGMTEENNKISTRKLTPKSYLMITILTLIVVFIINLILFITEKGGNAVPILLIILASLIITLVIKYIIIDIVRIYREKTESNNQ